MRGRWTPAARPSFSAAGSGGSLAAVVARREVGGHSHAEHPACNSYSSAAAAAAAAFGLDGSTAPRWINSVLLLGCVSVKIKFSFIFSKNEIVDLLPLSIQFK